MRPTTTDANLVLGFLDPDNFLRGEMKLDRPAAERALAKAGATVGLSARELALAAERIIDNQIADAIRLRTVQEGQDPRRLVLYSCGGAGALHLPAVAFQLQIPEVVIPLGELASCWSAFGVGTGDALVVEERPFISYAPFDFSELDRKWSELEVVAADSLEKQGIKRSAITISRFADMKYATQVNEVEVFFSQADELCDPASWLMARFEEAYESLFGQGAGYRAAGIAVTNLRVRARAELRQKRLKFVHGQGDDQLVGPRERSVSWYELGADPVSTPVFSGESLRLNGAVPGPCIVEYPMTTVSVRPGQAIAAEADGTLHIRAIE
jgi:N-methylhydantoinase A